MMALVWKWGRRGGVGGWLVGWRWSRAKTSWGAGLNLALLKFILSNQTRFIITSANVRFKHVHNVCLSAAPFPGIYPSVHQMRGGARSCRGHQFSTHQSLAHSAGNLPVTRRLRPWRHPTTSFSLFQS